MIRLAPHGWRGTLADEITLESARRVAAAVATALNDSGTARQGVVVGHDARFLADRFAAAAAAVLAEQGVPVLLAGGPLPCPAVAYAVAAGRRAAGLTFTGGERPPEEGGLLLHVARGAPAAPEFLRLVEAHAGAAAEPGRRPPARRRAAPIRRIDPRAGYLNALTRAVAPGRLRRARLRLACDARHGAASGWLSAALRRCGGTLVEALHDTPHPEFQGEAPSCADRDLRDLARSVRRGRLHLGLAVNADGSRFGVVDARGAALPPGALLALVADFLLAEGRVRGGLARSIATTHLIDDVASLHGRALYETAAGFASVVAPLLRGEAGLACEEGGGLALATHLPDRDGLLAVLLAAEMVAARRQPLGQQIAALFKRIGPRCGRRIDYHVDPVARDRVLRRLDDPPARFAGRPVQRISDADGSKWILADGSWVLFRASHEESALRCHVEARSPGDLETLTEAVRAWVARG